MKFLIFLVLISLTAHADEPKNVEPICFRNCSLKINAVRQLLWTPEERAKAEEILKACKVECGTDKFTEEELKIIDEIVIEMVKKEGLPMDFDFYSLAQKIVLKRRALRVSNEI